MNDKTKKFAEEYNKLVEISNKLDSQELIDLDELVLLITQSTESYKFCQEKIESVEKILKEKLKEQ